MAKKEKPFLIEAKVRVPCVMIEIRSGEVFAISKKEAVEKYKRQLEQNNVELIGEPSKRTSPVPGIIGLGIVVVMSFFKYYEPKGFASIQLFPDMKSLLIAMFIYSGFVIRIQGIKNTFRDLPNIILSVLVLVVIGIFINIFAGTSRIPNGWVRKFLEKLGLGNNYWLIFTAIVLSWLGLKQICGLVLIVLMVLGIAEISTCGKYMGNIKGAVFLLSAFFGFVMYLKYEGALIIDSFKRLAVQTGGYVADNLNASRAVAHNSINNFITKQNAKTDGREISKIEEHKTDE